MTPEQLAEIEQRWADNEVTMQTINDFNLLLAEVRKLQEKLHYEETCHAEAQEEVRRLNRMVSKACRALEWFDDCHSKGQGCNEKRCAECWKEYLEAR